MNKRQRMKLISRTQRSTLKTKAEGPALSPSTRLLFKMDNKLSIQKGHFQRQQGREEVKHASGWQQPCSECNGRLLQHLRPSHIFKASIPATKPLATLAFLSSLTKPPLCLLFHYLVRGHLYNRQRELNKQTQSSVKQCLIESHMAPSLFIFSIAVQEGSTLESKSSPASSLRGLVSVATSQGNFLSFSDTLFN